MFEVAALRVGTVHLVAGVRAIFIVVTAVAREDARVVGSTQELTVTTLATLLVTAVLTVNNLVTVLTGRYADTITTAKVVAWTLTHGCTPQHTHKLSHQHKYIYQTYI